jgi:DNA-binding MarR family transcriptional regulator
VYVNLQVTADRLLQGLEKMLKASKLSQTQYNVLRILRGSSPDGLACREVGARMMTRDPDVTRLLDRMETNGLVLRTRDNSDRRVVKASLTNKGARLLASLDDPVAKCMEKLLGHLSDAQLGQLSALLDTARERKP